MEDSSNLLVMLALTEMFLCDVTGVSLVNVLVCICFMTSRAVNELLGKLISVLFFQPGESPILSRPGGGDTNFSQEGRFYLTKNRGGEKKKKEARDRPHTAEDERKLPRRSRNDKYLIIFYIFLPLL